MRLELVTKKDVTYVELQKDKKHSFGVSLRDGTQDEGGPVVKKVEQKSPAEKSFAVSKDDVILSVNGFSTAGARCKDVQRMLKDAGSDVNLQLLYKTRETKILECSAFRKQQITIRLQKVNGSFGFLIRKKTSKYSFSMQYPTVSNIKEGSSVHKSGQLQEGDRLLMIDGVSLSWMPLSYVASLLQEKVEAEFTFEYNVGVFNCVEEGAKLDLEIDIPVADLGIDIRACDEEGSVMYIGNIRQASIAQRCGIFSEGDIILSINDIATKDLTFPKAYFLLRNTKKSRKISFTSNRPKEKNTEAPQENVCSSADNNEDDDDMVSTESYTSSSGTVDWKHLNTPASSNFAFSEQQKYNFQSFCHSEQFKTVDKFQSMFSVLSSLKQNLSTLTREAFRGTQNMLSRNCTSCNRAQHTVKLCTSCLARMNVKCAQSMDVLRNLVAHFVRFSTNGVYGKEKRQFGVSVVDITNMLSETLPDILGVPELKECFANLAKKLSSADVSCSTCDFEVKSVVMIVQQLLLVLTVTDNSEEFADLIEHLVGCLFQMKFTCDSKSESTHSTTDENVSESENISESVLIRIEEEEGSSGSSSSQVRNNSETESNGIDICIESNLNFPQVKASVNHEYLKLTHIKSLSESRNSVSANEDCESNALSAPLIDSRSKPREENVAKTSTASVASDKPANSRMKKLIKSMNFPKVWRSLDSLIRPRRPSQIFGRTQNACHPTYNQCKSNDSSTVERKVHSASTINSKNNLSPSHVAEQEERTVSNSNRESPLSFSRLQDDNNSPKPSKTQPDTTNVTLRNEGDGFGLDISLVAGSRIPVIKSIQPKSPAFKMGVLKEGDRILSINQRNTSRIAPKQLQSLKKKAFSADSITLCAEFDVEDKEYQFGIFDVVLGLHDGLKAGLSFEDRKKDCPMVVSSIAKGSAAHRCGQLFPGDKILFFKYSKKEEFDPMSCRYTTQRFAVITVERNPRDVLERAKRRGTLPQSYANPCFQQEDSSSRNGLSFAAKSTPVRSMDALDHSGDSSSRNGRSFPRQNTPVRSMENTDALVHYTDSSSRNGRNFPRQNTPVRSMENTDALVHSEDSSSMNSWSFAAKRTPVRSMENTDVLVHSDDSSSRNGRSFAVKRTTVRSMGKKDYMVLEHEVTLFRDPKSFDFGILLGEDKVTGRAHVKDIRPNGPAHKSRVIKKYDRIVEVDGELVNSNVRNSVLELISRANQKVDLLIRRIYREKTSES